MKVYFRTLGCPKNQTDSDVAIDIIERAGHSLSETPEDADVIVVNTCGFIEDAKKESIAEIFAMAEEKGESKKLIATGCLVQRYSDDLFSEMPEVDAFLGVNDYEKLPEVLAGFESGSRERPKLDSEYISSKAGPEGRHVEKGAHTAYLRISEGCNNICSYCVIPKIRGPYRSRTMEDIRSEAEHLASSGVKELILIAEDVSNYGSDNYGCLKLPELLDELCGVSGIEWIRLLYCYEDRITDELIETMARQEKVLNYIDIPLQHGSDKVLSEMNRRSTNASIRDTISKLRLAMPDIAIRTTFIVGFPGETDEDFDQLLDLAEDAEFDRLGAFTYSREEGTPVGEREDQIPEELKQQRLDALMMRQMEISLALNQEKIGTELDVIIDEIDGDAYIGRAYCDAPEIDNTVLFDSNKDHKPGDIVKVRITDAFDYDLQGTEVE